MSDILAQFFEVIISHFGPYPLLLFLSIMGLAPFAAVVWIVWRLPKLVNKVMAIQDDRMNSVFERQDKRFEQVVKMYEDNVELVKDYQTHVLNQRETNDKLIDLVSISTSVQQTLVDYIKTNMFCPLVKQSTKHNKIERSDG